MRNSTLKKIGPFSKAKIEVLKNVVQLTVHNQGTRNITVYGQVVLPNATWDLPSSNTKCEFDLKELEFDGTTSLENKALIFYQKVTETTLPKAQKNCS